MGMRVREKEKALKTILFNLPNIYRIMQRIETRCVYMSLVLLIDDPKSVDVWPK